MSIGLGRKILGIFIALGGISALTRDQHDVIAAGLMFAAGIALFFWGTRATVKK